MYLKAFSFEDYIYNHLGFSSPISGSFISKDTKQACPYFWLESLYVSLRWKMGNREESKAVGQRKGTALQYIHLPLKGALPMLTSNLAVFKCCNSGWSMPTTEHVSSEGKYSNTPRMSYWTPPQKPCYTECTAKMQTLLQGQLLHVLCYMLSGSKETMFFSFCKYCWKGVYMDQEEGNLFNGCEKTKFILVQELYIKIYVVLTTIAFHL